MSGQVSLVGAGPGDPDLLTVAAQKRLEAADLVLYDALVSPAVLLLAGRAQRFCVGKRSRRPSMGQDTINRLMIRAARRGKKVVRLKGGDPFVLGRGGEEALALARAGVPFEVVPGVTSAIAAASLSGIPVTHRGLSAGFLVVSGHAESAWASPLAGLRPGSVTLVVLMGIEARREIAARLLALGWPKDLPAAVVLSASTPEASTWLGTLEGLQRAELPEKAEGLPGTLVIGEVVSLAPLLAPQVADEPGAEPEAIRSRARTWR